ncbi:PucR family transcriptional regulator [Brevibacterium zhoupengii]|uniref:PucR family transcriptional regulator n=1 Tax=Brevibacterium zhoupengii TaxID=2898795 RepID=UPI001E55630A|nr:helix-turn-helix domain-containing protein [Brevibacterium zhoupengii]
MSSALSEVALRIREDEDSIADLAASRIYGELATYVGVPRDELLASVRTNARRAVDVLISRQIPSVSENAEHRATTRARIDENVPIEDIIRAYRISLSATHDSFISKASAAGLDPQSTLDGATLLWRLGDWFTAGAATEYRYRAGTEAMRQSFEIGSLVRKLTTESVIDDDTTQQVKKYGVDIDGVYAVAAVPASGHDVEKIIRDVKSSGSTVRAQALVAQIDLRVIAIVARKPTEAVSDVPIAIGPFVPLTQLATSARICEQVWKLARKERSGVHSMESYGWRLAVPDSTDINEFLIHRYISPLRPGTAAGRDILETLRTWLRASSSVRRTAEELNVHENTVRYRLQRFSDLIGGFEYGIDELLGLRWALEAYDSGCIAGTDPH